MTSRPSEKFQELLLNFSQSEEIDIRHNIENALWAEYGAEYAVFVLDMSGFSLLTRKYGIVHYLSMVRRMQLTTEPIVKSYGGSMIKYEADNCFAVFPDPLSAVNAAIAMQHAFEAANLLTSDDLDIYISCGIDYGKLLIVGHEDCFGDPVNRASKMGEDLAAAGEILITKEAMEMIPAEAGIRAHEMNVSISGITIPAFMIEYRSEEKNSA
ncbi:MAG TPA: adenylate/guanylate cyclase domain-containing protein [Anaerolineales bacterium]|nr:adenylate/guanylate cyclase domain-containing protein [Anaerolineales bacterium]HLO28524.1 adenylate/guanylate cyclase domain-containing protein [Anaerolineales bacterium]